MNEESLLRLEAVEVVYPGPPPVHALKPTDLAVRCGDHLAVTGPSGSGKSTLLNILGLLDVPVGGRYWFGGVDVARLSDRERTAMRARRIGFVFQSFHLMRHRTAADNVAVPFIYQGISRTERLGRAREALAAVGLEHRVDALPATMSGGEQQRVAIARALATRPALLLCDEPTGNLDSANAARVLDLISALHGGGQTVITITHDASVAARADRVAQMLDGKLTLDAPETAA